MLKELFQRRALRKGASPEPTGLVPLSRIRTAVVLTDSPGDCSDAVRGFSRKHGIKCTVVNVTGVFANLNWFDKPRMAQPLEAELLISLVPARLFALDYIAACARSRLKVGRYDAPVFDVVFNGECPQAQAFGEIVKLLEKIA